MLEQGYQAKIMKEIESIGGWSVNGVYSKSGEADLQNGYPINGLLHYLVVEVKTKKDYARVMSGVVEEDNRYVIWDKHKLKDHEPVQIQKLNLVRERGGLAVLAYSFKQVKSYVDKHRANL